MSYVWAGVKKAPWYLARPTENIKKKKKRSSLHFSQGRARKKSENKTNTIATLRIHLFRELDRGSKGILKPASGKKTWNKKNEVILLIRFVQKIPTLRFLFLLHFDRSMTRRRVGSGIRIRVLPCFSFVSLPFSAYIPRSGRQSIPSPWPIYKQ